MEVRPAVRIGELDDCGHAQKAERRPAGKEAEREQDRQYDFARARHRRDEFRHWKRDLGAEDVELVFLRKQDLRSERQREPAVPAREPRGEEGPRQREPQDKQRQPFRNEPEDDAGQAADQVQRGESRGVCGVGDHDRISWDNTGDGAGFDQSDQMGSEVERGIVQRQRSLDQRRPLPQPQGEIITNRRQDAVP